MAAGSISNDFDMGLGFNRKRRYGDDDDAAQVQDLVVAKRRNLTQLPIRSPSRPSIAVTPANSHFGIHPGTLTPDSIPEDDEFRSHNDPTLQRQDFRPHSNSNASSKGSLRVDVDSSREASTDIEMDIGSPKQRPPPTPVRIGRARSNDLMSPVRSPTAPNTLSFFIGSPASRTFARDRIPTPVVSSFPAPSPFESSFASAAARQKRPHLLSTSLSPMMDAESWTPLIQRPPSPAPELDAPFDEDAMMMGVQDSHMMSSSFSSLSMHSQAEDTQLADLNSSPTKGWSSQTSPSPRARGLGLDGASSVRPDDLRMSTINDSQRMAAQHNRVQSSGRTARLHMGFRADCEKCVARVPGHYSHIFWS